MFQAIETKYLAPTNHRGSRVLVKAQAGRMMVEWDDALDSDGNHNRAARLFAKKWGWKGKWMGGGKADGCGNVYVRAGHARGGYEFEVAS